MSVLFERGDVKLFNSSVDENLGYNKRHRPFVREWVEFGSGSSPGLLDACYYALQDVNVGSGYESQGIGISSGDIYGRGRK
jgi:hypothetical protein